MRVVLDALRLKKIETVSSWLLRSLDEEPFKESNAKGLLEIASHLAFLTQGPIGSGFYAKSYIEKVLAADPTCIEALLLVADIFRLGAAGVLRDLPKAVEYFRRVLDVSRNNAVALSHLGDIYRKGGPGVPKDIVRAEHCLRRAVHTNKKAVEPRLLLGMLYCMEGFVAGPSTREGEKFFKEALALDKRNVTALNCLGDLSYKFAEEFGVNLPEAKKFFKRALRVDSRNEVAKYNLEQVSFLQYVQKQQEAPNQPDYSPEALSGLDALSKIAQLEDACDVLLELRMHAVAKDTMVRVLKDVIDVVEKEEVGELLITMSKN